MVRPVLEQEYHQRDVAPDAFVLSEPAYHVLRGELAELTDQPWDMVQPVRYRGIPLKIDRRQSELVVVEEHDGPVEVEDMILADGFDERALYHGPPVEGGVFVIGNPEDNPFQAAESLESWINWIRSLGEDERDEEGPGEEG